MEMSADAQGRYHSYYGKWHINDPKPRVGVVTFMLDEHVKKTVEREKEKLHKELLSMMKNFISSIEDNIVKNEENIKSIKVLNLDLTKLVYEVIKTNKLLLPTIEKVDKSRKSRAKIKESEASEEDLDELDEVEG